MDDTNETIADIIAEMRGMGNYQRYSGDHARVLAARLEAALKRELSKAASKNGADFGQLGDAAKLREALEELVANIEMRSSTFGLNVIVDTKTYLDAKAALAAPPRNCDRFASAEEAWDAYDEWVESYRSKGKTEPFNEFGWLLAPATKKEGESDEQK